MNVLEPFRMYILYYVICDRTYVANSFILIIEIKVQQDLSRKSAVL